jgi:hypothetical protein
MAPTERKTLQTLPAATHPMARKPRRGRFVRAGVAFGLALLSGLANAQSVQCHLAYAGATRTFVVTPSTHVNEPATLVEGSSFVFKVLNRIPPVPGAGVRISAFGVFSDAPFLLHEATYLSTTAPGGATHGFTGLQLVREPLRHNELAYWCERLPD